MSQKWLKCSLLRGMFSDEMVVVIKTLSGEESSFFVPRQQVRGEVGKIGQVMVRTFEQGAHPWAVIPNDSQSMIPVDESEFAAA